LGGDKTIWDQLKDTINLCTSTEEIACYHVAWFELNGFTGFWKNISPTPPKFAENQPPPDFGRPDWKFSRSFLWRTVNKINPYIQVVHSIWKNFWISMLIQKENLPPPKSKIADISFCHQSHPEPFRNSENFQNCLYLRLP